MSDPDSSIRRLTAHIARQSDAAIQSASGTLSDEATREAERTAAAASSAASAALAAHTSRTDNPHAVTAAQLADLPEAVQDIVGAMVKSGAAISVTYNDTTGEVTLAVTAATTLAAGSMSAVDKAKLDGIAAGADPTGATIHAAAAKTTPVDADETALVDSAASNALKRVTWASVKATLKTYFDTLYALASHAHAYVTGVTGTAPIVSSGGTAPAISISTATTGAAGSMSAADKTKADAYPAVAGLTAGQALRASAAGAVAYGAIDLGNASAVAGTLADARLSANVPLKNAANTFSAAQVINGALDLNIPNTMGTTSTVRLSDDGRLKLTLTRPAPNRSVALAFDSAAQWWIGADWIGGGGQDFFIYHTPLGERDFSIDANGRIFFYHIRTAPASPAAGEVYKDASGFLKIG